MARRFNKDRRMFDAAGIFDMKSQRSSSFEVDLSFLKPARSWQYRAESPDLIDDGMGSTTLSLPPINPNHRYLVTTDRDTASYSRTLRSNSHKSPRQSSPRKQRHFSSNGMRNCCDGGASGQLKPILKQNIVRCLDDQLKSGTIRYKSILPPIGSHYTVRIHQYYAEVVEEADHWLQWNHMGDFFETMRHFFCQQSKTLEDFLLGEISGRRNAMYCEDEYQDVADALANFREKLISECLARYTF